MGSPRFGDDFNHFGPVDGLKENDGRPTWTEEEEKAVRRKFDYHIVPLVTLLYLLCFVCSIKTYLKVYVLTWE
jgi:hypothetical protein